LLTHISAPLFELALSPGKGFGLFATTSIARGTRIIEEAPLMTIPSANHGTERTLMHFIEAVGDAPYKNVVAFARLHHKGSAPATSETLATLAQDYVDPNKSQGTAIDVEHAVHIFQVNAAAMGYTGELGSGVFKSFSRINHSCTPNVHHSYNPTLKKLTVHATRHINKGEEILTTYTNLDRIYEQRTDLLSNWHVRCECKCCAGPNADASKGRRVRMFEADQ
jgi:hypothetical protein